MNAWSPEVVVDGATARRLIESQFPELRGAALEPLGEGWDMTVYLVGGELVFRFPRRDVVVPALLRELEVLPRIAPALPLPIPEPRFIGSPEAGYPWPFYGAPLIPGREVGQDELDQDRRDALAPALGRFLRALHELPAAGLPTDPNRRADMPLRAARVRETVGRLETAGVWSQPPLLASLLREAEALEPPGDLVLAHGDLHLRHLLVADGRASGVIDWIDVCAAPRSIDLVLYWCLLSETGRRPFRSAYGEVDDATLLRARVLAVNLCAILADYARVEGAGWLLREAVAGLDLALS